MTAFWSLRPPELDVDAEMRREAAYRLNLAADAEGMPDKARIAALSLAIWISTDPGAAGAARVLLGRPESLLADGIGVAQGGEPHVSTARYSDSEYGSYPPYHSAETGGRWGSLRRDDSLRTVPDEHTDHSHEGVHRTLVRRDPDGGGRPGGAGAEHGAATQ